MGKKCNPGQWDTSGSPLEYRIVRKAASILKWEEEETAPLQVMLNMTLQTTPVTLHQLEDATNIKERRMESWLEPWFLVTALNDYIEQSWHLQDYWTSSYMRPM